MPYRPALAGALVLALAAPAFSQTRDTPVCRRGLAAAAASLDASAARLKHAAADDVCSVYRLHFVETVKARAVTAQCKTGAERDQALVRLDHAVDEINTRIAQCG
ncbi:MAG: hypothetical protein AB7K35_16170 [Pseudorhodoplanes sp.]